MQSRNAIDSPSAAAALGRAWALIRALAARKRTRLPAEPWMARFPGAAIFLVVPGFDLLGDGLRDALDPRETQEPA